MKRSAAALILTLITVSGCSFITSGFGFRDLIVFQDQAIANRNKNEAYKAWKLAKWDYWRQGVPHYLREHIGRGFQQGFADVAGGGSGELPLFPPNNYWGPGYQTTRGNEMIAAWFRGYTDGAMAGEQSGLPRYVTLPTSSSAPMPTGGQVINDDHGQKPAATPWDYLPPDYRDQPEAIPAVPPPPPIVPPQGNEPLPLPPGGPTQSVPKTTAPMPKPPVVEPAPVPGKQTFLLPGPSKSAIIAASPILKANADAASPNDGTR